MASSATIQTQSGRIVDLLNFNPSDVDIDDIAHALAHQCRFGGHVREFVSVAQHSVLVSMLVPPQFQLHGLLHDGHEAYMTDIPTPLKRLLPEYYVIAEGVQKAINNRFALSEQEPLEVKEADRKALVIEAMNFMPSSDYWIEQAKSIGNKIPILKAMPPDEAKLLFVNRFYEIENPVNPVKTELNQLT